MRDSIRVDVPGDRPDCSFGRLAIALPTLKQLIALIPQLTLPFLCGSKYHLTSFLVDLRPFIRGSAAGTPLQISGCSGSFEGLNITFMP